MDAVVLNLELEAGPDDRAPRGEVAIDRRRHERRRCEQSDGLQMRLRTGDVLSVVDISAGGALVESRRRLLPGVTIVVHLAGADGTRPIDARAVRCWVSALEPGGGVRYRGALEFVGNTSI